MLQFKKIEITDRDKANTYLKKINYYMCVYCFTDLFIWSSHYGTSIAYDEEFLYLKYTDGKKVFFYAPIGDGDYRRAVENMAEIAHMHGCPLVITSIPVPIREKLEAACPDRFEYTDGRDWGDYIYLAEKLMYLKGRNLHGKRNHINKFLSEYEGRWVYEDLTPDKIHEFFDYQLEWCADNPDDFLGETCAVSLALKNMEALEIKGGLLRLDGRLIAVTLGSESAPDTFTVHIEKADASVPGAYQMINQQFALHNFEKYTYINREEDMGIEGLRKAKLSYFPEMIVENYTAQENQ